MAALGGNGGKAFEEAMKLADTMNGSTAAKAPALDAENLFQTLGKLNAQARRM